MTRCIAETSTGYVNIPADRLERDRDAGMIYVYSEDNLTGAFDVSALVKIYLSDKKECR